jgi:hypothetical protein
MVSHTFNHKMTLSRNNERHKLHVPSLHRSHTSPGQTNGCFFKLMLIHCKLQLDLGEQNGMNLLLWTSDLETLVTYCHIMQSDRCQ